MFIINAAVLHQNKWKTYTQQFGMELSWNNTLCLNIDILFCTQSGSLHQPKMMSCIIKSFLFRPKQPIHTLYVILEQIESYEIRSIEGMYY